MNKHQQNIIEDIYPLSQMQEGILFHTLLHQDTAAYIEQYRFNLLGDIDINIVKATFDELTSRHAILRTAFVYENIEEPVQVVLKKRKIRFDYLELTTRDFDTVIASAAKDDAEEKFDLASSSLMRIHIFKLGSKRFHFIWTWHHILMDGWSFNLLTKEFFKIYDQILNFGQCNLPLPRPFKEYINYVQSKNILKTQLFWKDYLKDVNSKTRIPQCLDGRHLANNVIAEDFEKILVRLDHIQKNKIEKICASLNVTLSSFVKTTWGICLAKLNESKQVVYGEVVSGRPHQIEDVENMVGLFINTVPVKVEFHPKDVFEDLVKQIHVQSLEKIDHCHYPLAKLKSDYGPSLNFDHIMIYQNFPVWSKIDQKGSESQLNIHLSKGGDIVLTDLNIANQLTEYPFIIEIQERNELIFIFDFNKRLFRHGFVNRLAEYLKNVIEQVIRNSRISIASIEIITLAEKSQILKQFNPFITTIPTDTFIDRFANQVSSTPDKIALIYGNHYLTYKEIQEEADNITNILLGQYQVKKGDMIGFSFNKSNRAISIIIGILKSGGVYVPLNVDDPIERIRLMLNESNLKILIVDPHNYEKFKKISSNILLWCINKDLPIGNVRHAKPKLTSKDLAYIIFTSGTSGLPKGVMIDHGALSSKLTSEQKVLSLSGSNYIVNTSSFSFDPAFQEALLPLSVGACVVMPEQNFLEDVYTFLDFITKTAVTDLPGTPAHISLLVDHHHELKQTAIKRIYCGGDNLTKKLVHRIKDALPDVIIYNFYGPTEVTIDATVYENVTTDDKNNIGRPLIDTNIYIVNNDLQLQPIGIEGQLCIAGNSLARGYINDVDKTARFFIQNPFVSHCQRKMYLTGDMARWLEDGTIEFLGRKDKQIKLNGFRIELGEIEKITSQESGVETITRLFNYKGKDQLIAFFKTKTLDALKLRNNLKIRLPSYMIPNHFVCLKSFPYNTNGKIDDVKLQSFLPEKFSVGYKFEKANNSTETLLCELLSEFLNTKAISVNDNFFEIGGDSILAIRLLSRLNKIGYRLKLSDLYKTPVISQLANLLTKSLPNKSDSVTTGEILLSPTQKEFFLKCRSSVNHFNFPFLITTKFHVNEKYLQETILVLTEYHDMLRACYPFIKDNRRQIVEDLTTSIHFQTYDFSGSIDDDDQVMSKIRYLQKSFNTEKAPLIKWVLFRMTGQV